MTRQRFRLSRSHFIAGFLLVILGLAAVLGYEAFRSQRSHQAAAANALEDHAAMVAWRYAGHAEGKLEWLIASPTFNYLLKMREKEAWPGEEVATAEEKLAAEKKLPMRFAFTLDPKTGKIALRKGWYPPKVVWNWVADTVMAALPSYDPQWHYALIAGAPDRKNRFIFFTVEFAERERRPGAKQEIVAVVGFEAEPSAFSKAFGHAFSADLLPPTMTRGVPNPQMLSVRVFAPTGQSLWASKPEYSWEFSAVDYMSPQFGGLPVEVAIRPKMAENLVIGGLPKSRLPLIAGLLILAVGLAGASMLLLRREFEIARLRTEFVSNVSHELRTPLAQVRMFVETLLLGRVRNEDERRKSLEIMNREIRRLGNLVENILAFSRAERGGIKLKMEPTELSPLFEEVVSAFLPLAAGKKVALRTDIEQEATATVDRSALRQILLNLLDNAVKYGPIGQTITLGLDVENGRVRFRVEDEGPGIPSENREAVWEAFVRLDREREQATAGTGIGLSVVRDLVRHHEGRAWVEEGTAGGARFMIELPREPNGADGDVSR